MTDKESVMQALKDSLRNQHCGFIENVGNVYAVSEETINDTLELLKEQEKQKFFVDESGKITPLPEIVRCKDCKNWIAGYITDQDDFIPSKCEKYQQMVGHSNDDFCSLAERRAEWDESER